MNILCAAGCVMHIIVWIHIALTVPRTTCSDISEGSSVIFYVAAFIFAGLKEIHNSNIYFSGCKLSNFCHQPVVR